MDIQNQPSVSLSNNKLVNQSPITRGFGVSGAAKDGRGMAKFTKIIFSISLVLAFLAVAIGAGGFFWQRNLDAKTQSLQSQITDIESHPVIDASLAKEITMTSESIKALKNLLTQHIISAELFRFIEANTLTKVKWTQVEFKAPQAVVPTGNPGTGLASVNLSGSTVDYLFIGRQLRAFEGLPEVKSVKLEQFSETDAAAVFSMALEISPDNFFLNLSK